MKALGKSHNNDVVGDDNRNDFVFVKDFRIDDGDSAIQKVNSLNASRTALENLEDQLEIFHTVHTQQRAERDASIARLEQSRIILALRLAEHHRKMYKIAYTEHPEKQKDNINRHRNVRKNSQLEGPSSYGRLNHLDVFSAQGMLAKNWSFYLYTVLVGAVVKMLIDLVDIVVEAYPCKK
ncbi:hypothetical protein POUND7_012288 [Theobroma cacao]